MKNKINETIIRYFKVDPKEIVYIKAILEAYEDMAIVRTLEGHKEIIEILIAYDLHETIAKIIHSLQQEVSMEEIQGTNNTPSLN